MSKYIRAVLILVCFCFAQHHAFAMQTVFVVPSADVTPKGHFFIQEEGQFRAWNPDAYFISSTFTAYGVGHNTEVDVNLFGVGAPATNSIAIGTGFKTVMPVAGLKEKFPEREIKFTVGSNLLIGVEGNGVGTWTYGHLSGRLPKANTRLTAGLSYGTKQVFGVDSLSFIAAVEQPVTKKLSLIGDWFSGDEHFAGYLVVGASYVMPKNTTLYAGYQIPNSTKNGASGLVVQIAKTF